jgi:hypothetical protein
LGSGGAGTVRKRSLDYSGTIASGNGRTSLVTADRIFYPLRDNVGLGLQLLEFDLPDLSTPTNATAAVASFAAGGGVTDSAPFDSLWTDSSVGPAFVQRATFAAAIKANYSATGLVADFATDAASGASTDVVLSQPLRRYYYQYTDGKQNPSTTPTAGSYHRHFGYYELAVGGASANAVEYYGKVLGDDTTAYEALNGESNQIPAGCPSVLDSEERRITVSQSGVSFSPKPPVFNATCSYRGEVAVLDLNGVTGSTLASAALGAILTRTSVSLSGITNGWASFSATNTGASAGGWDHSGGTSDATAYPIIGFKATNYSGGLARSIVLPFKY